MMVRVDDKDKNKHASKQANLLTDIIHRIRVPVETSVGLSWRTS